jgi:hypothetical protein
MRYTAESEEIIEDKIVDDEYFVKEYSVTGWA